MRYCLPFRNTFIKHPEKYNYPLCLSFELDYDKQFHYITQKRNIVVFNIMEQAYQNGVDPTVNAGEGEFGKSIEKGFDYIIDRLVDKNKVETILEVGSGTGAFVKKLRNKGYDAEGVEPGKSLCRIAKERYDVYLHCGYLHEIKFDKKFDLVYAHGSLDHAPNQAELVQQMSKVAKPKGTTFFNVPNQEIPLKVGAPSMMVHQHRAYFTPSSATGFLEKLGLINIDYWESPFCAHYLYFWGTFNKIIGFNNIKSERSIECENQIIVYNYRVNEFLARLQQLTDDSIYNRKSIGLYGAISYPLGLLNWHGVSPRIFDKDWRKHGFYLPCNSVYPVESPENLSGNPVDVLWVMAWRYDKQIQDFVRSVGFSDEIVSIKDLLGIKDKE